MGPPCCSKLRLLLKYSSPIGVHSLPGKGGDVGWAAWWNNAQASPKEAPAPIQLGGDKQHVVVFYRRDAVAMPSALRRGEPSGVRGRLAKVSSHRGSSASDGGNPNEFHRNPEIFLHWKRTAALV